MRNGHQSPSGKRAALLAAAVCAALLAACADPTGLPRFTVDFNLNGGSGTPPPSQTVEAGSTITLPGGGGFLKTGHNFIGWSTNIDGTGTDFNAGAPYTPSGNRTMFARWAPVGTFIVSFNANGGTGTVPAVTANQGQGVTLPNAAGLSKDGHAFAGWNRRPDGTGTKYAAGSTFTPPGDITLYARWVPAYTVSFNANMGIGTVPALAVPRGSSEMLPGGTGLSRARYAFDGWNERPDGMGVNRSAGYMFTPQGNTVLYARWVPGFTVTFDANGGDGTVPAQAVLIGSAMTLPDGAGLSRPGYAFAGWNENAAGTGINRNAGSSFTPADNVTLFARWVRDGGVAVPGETLAARLAWLQTNTQTDGSYFVEVTGDEDIAPHALAFSGRTNVTVTLRGVGQRITVGLTANGSLFTIGPGVTLVLDGNITLHGRPSNNAALVQVNSGGSLVMNAGARITGNVNTTIVTANHGGGVRVNASGSFVMNGGDIWGNASAAGDGGGVHVATGGGFDMRGGTVSDNSAGRRGGGVLNAGTFRISDGIVHGGDAEPGIVNVAGDAGDALDGAALLGTFGDDGFTQLDALTTTDVTMHVVQGVLQTRAARVTVAFDADGGGGTIPAPRRVDAGTVITLPGGDGLVREGFVFGGWNTMPGGAGDDLVAGAAYTATGDITLYARWLVTWAAISNSATNTTAINLVFGAPVPWLAEEHVTLADRTSAATRGALTGGGAAWSLAVAVTSLGDGDITVSITAPGIQGRIEIVPVYRPPVYWIATAYGDPHTTAIDFVFSEPVTGLTAGHIAVADGTGAVTTGNLTGGGAAWRLAIGVARAGDVSVSIDMAGIYGRTETVEVSAVTWTATAYGDPYTTAIDFVFSEPVMGLTAEHIAVAARTGAVTTGALTGGGTAWSLAVTVGRSGDVSVSVDMPGVESEPRTVVIPALKIDLVRIPSGTFLMGSPEGTPNSQANERPVREVTISGFYMGRFPVTQGEWYDVMGTNPSNFHSGHSAIVAAGVNWRNLPVERVSWYDALVFSNRLSIMRGLSPAYSIGGSTNPDDWGLVPTTINATWNAVTIVPGSTGYRLPTEAQWEFAARGGNGSPGNFTFSGSNNAAEVAWHNANSGGRTHEVGTLMPNALGLYDMSGNVWEWVWDRFGTYPNTAQTDPTGAAAGDFRVFRGGGWANPPKNARSVLRSSTVPVHRSESSGFRVVRP